MKLKHKKLGLVVKKYSNYHYKIISEGNNKNDLIYSFLVENSNDWEEVKEDGAVVYATKSALNYLQSLGRQNRLKEEPNYLITAFRDSFKKIYKIDSFGNFRLGDSIFSFNQMISTSDIYSCKNNIGDEFTIGDKVRFENIDRLEDVTINNFFMDKGRMIVRSAKENCGVTREINRVFKAKEPLYTTTDGADIYEGDKLILYVLSKNNVKHTVNIGELGRGMSKDDCDMADRLELKTFTSEENRDKYIKENKKPIFISADNVEVFEPTQKLYSVAINRDFETNDNFQAGYILSIDRGVTRTWKHFVMKKNRQEYIDNNKPKFSLKEIESCYPSSTNSPLFTTFIANLKKLGK